MAQGEMFDDVLAAAQAGAGWAFSRLYEDLAGPVTGYVRLRGAQDPDDVASETFLAVFRGIASFKGNEDQFRSWVFTIAHRRVLDERRHRSRRPSIVPLERDLETTTVEGPEAEVVGLLQTEWLREVIDELTDTQRDVVLLRVVAGLSIEETAQVVGKRPGAVKQLQRRGLLRLSEELSRRGVTL